MKDGVLPSITQRHRDKLTAKRLFAASAFIGLVFGLWILSTPVHQIYWAAQARLAEAKDTVLESGSPGDQACVHPFHTLCRISGCRNLPASVDMSVHVLRVMMGRTQL